MLEREIDLRRVTQASGGLTGWQTRPNANARLYLRTMGTHEPERLSAMDVDGMTVEQARDILAVAADVDREAPTS